MKRFKTMLILVAGILVLCVPVTTLAAPGDNQPPAIIALPSIGVTEDVTTALTGISFADPDAGSGTVDATFSVPSGTLSAVSASGVTVLGSGTGMLTLNGSIADINVFIIESRVTFTPAINSTSNVTLSVEINDGGNTGFGGALAASTTVTLVLSAVNDAPVNNVPGAQAVMKDGVLVFTAVNSNLISVSDADAGGGTVRVTLTAANGLITLGSTTGLSFLVGAGTGDATMTFEGTILDINAALSGLSYAPASGYTGAASLQIVSNDLGLSGSGGSQTDSDTIAISVLPAYNTNDYSKLQAFLNQPSAVSGQSNGQRINAAYNPLDPATWTGVVWTSGLDKRATQLSWSSCGLAGSLDISGFTGLTYVSLRDNSITSVNVSGDTAIGHLDVRATDITALNASGLTGLQTIFCSDSGWSCAGLTSLDVSGCTALEFVAASDSVITTLDVSGCTALETLIVENNSLTALDVSECTALVNLNVSGNNLGSLDVSDLQSLTNLFCVGNTNLTSLTLAGAQNLEYVQCMGCRLTTLDASGLTHLKHLDCRVNAIETLNLTGDKALEYLDCNANQIESLSVTGFSALTFLNCAQNKLTEIKGLSDTVNLGMLICGYNAIQSLDVSGMTSLAFLMCDFNRLTSLDVSGDTGLIIVSCTGNQLTSLDLSDAAGMMAVMAADNRLSSIKAVISGKPVNVTANRGGYVELFAYGVYYVNAVPCSGETFLGWTDASGAEVSAAARYDLSAGTAYGLTAKFTALELESSAADGTIYPGGRITLTPNHTGGTWSFDASYLSQDGNVFTALKTGKTRIEYKWGDETVAFEVTIKASELPETGQSLAWVWVLIGAAAALAAAGMLVRRRTLARR